MEMHQIRYFLAVCQYRNFTRAAEHCNVAQPSLTRAIKLLEEELGGALFHRERANTHLSELGQIVHPHLAQLHEHAQAVRREADELHKMKRARLRLGVMCTIAPTMLISLVSALQTRHPAVELHLTDGPAPELEKHLKEGEIEAAIYCDPNEREDERLHRLKLFSEQMVIALSKEHRLANRPAIKVADLEGEAYVNRINCEFNQDERSVFDASCWKAVHRCQRDDWALALVSTGAGFGFVPENCADHPGVVSRPLVEPEIWREVCLVTVRGRPHSPAVGALVREAKRIRWTAAAA